MACHGEFYFSATTNNATPVNNPTKILPDTGESDKSLQRTILVVDDDQEVRNLISMHLTSAGYEVALATNGREGLRLARELRPFAMTLDVLMPEIDGFTVLDELRKDPVLHDMPVIVLTAKDLTAKERAQLKYNNIKQLIRKGSVKRQELVAAVRSLVEPSPKTREADDDRQKTEKQLKLKPKPGGSRTILVVEDNSDNMITVTSVLAEAGCEIVTAEDGRQLQWLERSSPV